MSQYAEFKKVTPARVAYRFFLGRPLDGVRRTDSTFLRPARASLDPSGYATRWAMARGATRLGWRLLSLYVIGWVLLLLAASLLRGAASALGLTPPEPLRISSTSVLFLHAVVIGSILLPLLLLRLVLEFGLRLPYPVLLLHRKSLRLRISLEGWSTLSVEGRREWEREKVVPLARALDAMVGGGHALMHARQWVTVPRSYKEETGKPVEVLLPSTFTGADFQLQARISRTVAARLGMKEMASSWSLEGSTPRVLFSAPPSPPSSVSFSDVERFFLDTEEYRPFLGLATRGVAMHAEMIDDSPHIGISAGTGAGKTTLQKTIIMQALRWGWGVVVLDWKMSKANRWLIGLPGVTYITGIEAIHDMGVRLGEEVDIRKNQGMSGRAKVLISRNEWNMTADLLAAYWADLRSTEPDPEVKKTMPLKSPALRGFMSLDFAGREFGLFDLLEAQRFSARIFNGNADMRENFQIKLLSRYSTQTQKMLAGDIKPFPKRPTHVGQWVAICGEITTVFQAPLVTDEEAREYAQGGVPNPTTPLTGSYDPTVTQRTNIDSTQGDQLGHDLTRPNQGQKAIEGEVLAKIDARKLSEMVESLENFGITLNVLQMSVKRDETFPKPYGGSPNRGYTYDFYAVSLWARRRHARLEAERKV